MCTRPVEVGLLCSCVCRWRFKGTAQEASAAARTERGPAPSIGAATTARPSTPGWADRRRTHRASDGPVPW